MISETTKYQLCLDYFKLILKMKNLVDEETYLDIVDEAIEKIKNKDIPEEDINIFKDFLTTLDKKDFQDNCMKMYLKFKDYDNENQTIFPNLEFMKIQLYEYCLNQQTTIPASLLSR